MRNVFCAKGSSIRGFAGSGNQYYSIDRDFPYTPSNLGPVDTPLIIQDINIVRSDNVYLGNYVANKKSIYLFGNKYGTIAIKGVILLGSTVGNASTESQECKALSMLKDWFKENRIWPNKRLVKASLVVSGSADIAYFYPVALNIGSATNDTHILTWNIQGVVIESVEAQIGTDSGEADVPDTEASNEVINSALNRWFNNVGGVGTGPASDPNGAGGLAGGALLGGGGPGSTPGGIVGGGLPGSGGAPSTPNSIVMPPLQPFNTSNGLNGGLSSLDPNDTGFQPDDGLSGFADAGTDDPFSATQTLPESSTFGGTDDPFSATQTLPESSTFGGTVGTVGTGDIAGTDDPFSATQTLPESSTFGGSNETEGSLPLLPPELTGTPNTTDETSSATNSSNTSAPTIPLSTVKTQIANVGSDLAKVSNESNNPNTGSNNDFTKANSGTLSKLANSIGEEILKSTSGDSLAEGLANIPEVDATLLDVIADKETGGSGLLAAPTAPIASVASLVGTCYPCD